MYDRHTTFEFINISCNEQYCEFVIWTCKDCLEAQNRAQMWGVVNSLKFKVVMTMKVSIVVFFVAMPCSLVGGY